MLSTKNDIYKLKYKNQPYTNAYTQPMYTHLYTVDQENSFQTQRFDKIGNRFARNIHFLFQSTTAYPKRTS